MHTNEIDLAIKLIRKTKKKRQYADKFDPLTAKNDPKERFPRQNFTLKFLI